jgi:hypothetical protein
VSELRREAKEKAKSLRKQLAMLDKLTGGASERERDVERKREQRAAAKEVVVPPCADRARRERFEADDIAWLMHYFGPECGLRDPFWYEFTTQQREMISAIRHAILFGGDQAIAASRGEGKTTIFERLLLKYTLQGVLSFSVLCAATGTLAADSLDTIKAAIEDNPLLLADYPEVCVPVRALENTPNRAGYQLVTGERHGTGEPYQMASSKFSWCGQEIVFPNVPGAPAAQAIIATRGLDSAIRGLKRKGRRPQLVGIDDPETEETVRSGDQAKKLEDRIDRALGGLGSQQRPVGRVMLTTLQNRTCVSFKYTDPEQKPTWKGKRFRYLVTPPDRRDLWDEYVLLREKEFREFSAGRSRDEHCRQSYQFYLDHRQEMDTGAIVANENRFDATVLPDGTRVEASALQHYYNEVARIGSEAVAAELDNDPAEDENAALLLVLTAYHIQNCCLSGLDQRIVPDGTVCITVGADVQKLGLHYVVIAWDEHAAGCILYYDFFEFLTESRPASDCEVLILEGLFAWHEAQQQSPFVNAAGEEYFADLSLIDTGWKHESWNTQPVQVFCSQVGFGAFMPSKGESPYRRPQDSSRLIIGDNWHVSFPGGVPVAIMNSDHWKLKVHEGFLAGQAADGSLLPGALRVFNPPTIDGRPNRTAHLSFAKHILAETWETRFVPGFKGNRTGWWKSPKPNHYFDATYQAIVARSMRGIGVLETPTLPTTPAVQPTGQVQSTSSVASFERNRW